MGQLIGLASWYIDMLEIGLHDKIIAYSQCIIE